MWRKTLTLACVACVGLTATFLTAQEPDDLDTLRQKAIKAALLKVAPYVVTIETSGGTDFAIGGGGPGGGPGGPRLILKGTGPTTGLIVGKDGYIITSAFNFANKPSSIFVAVPGRKEKFVAKVT